MAEGKDHPPPLEDVVYGFISAQNDVALANDMKRVLATGKIIVLVDGLDEARGGVAPDSVLAGLTTFAETHNIPVIATSRPHGMRNLEWDWRKLDAASIGACRRRSGMRWRCSGIGYWSEAMLAPVQEQPSSKRRRSIVQRRSLLRWPRTPGSRVFHLHRCFSWRSQTATAPVALLPRNRFEASRRLLTSFWSTNPGVAQRMRSKPKRLRSIQGFATGLSKILPLRAPCG